MTAAEDRRPTSVLTPQRIAAARAHPDFETAVLALARTSVTTYSGHPLLNIVASDRGRFVVAMLVARLCQEGRLTPANLKQLAAQQGFASPGRTSALIALMRWAGYLTGEVRNLAPTPKFFAAHRERIAGELYAVGYVSPAAHAVAEGLADDALLCRFLAALCREFDSGGRLIDQAPQLEFCIERVGGFLVLNDLMLRAHGADAPLAVSVSAYSRRFAISRPQVHLVLRQAQAGGFLEWRDGRVVVRPSLHDGLKDFFAGVIVANSLAAEEAIGV
ncbi:hypothetical protein GVN21_09295 [Caulobacter sp. SLTY]|uniref:hypothetical protein n=1 Tax=Caulobacter sp. SLTY TaxID=2683262 RepID=UPI0014134C30|nr:hypothetical protein [Caulobacter sp. SLTY]NBB15548.1 hypothetical protein [Caulobacter sp. SLTY]